MQRIRLVPGAPLDDFDEVARDYFGFLATYGFQVEMSMQEGHYAMRRYRNGPRYITIEANTHPRNLPIYGNVKLGTGTCEFPESDWNHVSLWRLKADKLQGWQGKEYHLNRVTLDEFFKEAVSDLQAFAMHFITGEMKTFRRVRAEVNSSRKPYEMRPDGHIGQKGFDFIRTSIAMKEKYSREDAA